MLLLRRSQGLGVTALHLTLRLAVLLLQRALGSGVGIDRGGMRLLRCLQCLSVVDLKLRLLQLRRGHSIRVGCLQLLFRLQMVLLQRPRCLVVPVHRGRQLRLAFDQLGLQSGAARLDLVDGRRCLFAPRCLGLLVLGLHLS